MMTSQLNRVCTHFLQNSVNYVNCCCKLIDVIEQYVSNCLYYRFHNNTKALEIRGKFDDYSNVGGLH